MNYELNSKFQNLTKTLYTFSKNYYIITYKFQIIGILLIMNYHKMTFVIKNQKLQLTVK